ncbi:putative SRP receptor beta subunit [Plectosphaerella cucumerina]|jgi:signal recognition particle receptor subunit beta|uniref:Signal recognition particle receptor subunit beta n=1 Tax=Plectosphaerella cucumerina TaxID=40658 RepID=A0A8K0TQ46_9PEZI|nr:putative SRP receptor beta subunit [Plectosphaerella cucumerina]
MPSFTEIVEWLMSPSPVVFFFGFVIITFVPILLHTVMVAKAESELPLVIVAGPLQTGKTALTHLLEHGRQANFSFISQVMQSIELTASRDGDLKDDFRENRDDTSGTHTKFLLTDTPGHGKLRNLALTRIADTTGGKKNTLRSVVYVVDSAALAEQEVLADTAGYLYEILLTIQKASIRRSKDGARAGSRGVPVLIAANKSDLFTALPGTSIKTSLEAEITRIRNSKTHGLLDSGVGTDEIGSEERDDWLGEYGTKKFFFSQLAEFEIDVDIISGTVTADKEEGIKKWWQWIAYRI